MAEEEGPVSDAQLLADIAARKSTVEQHLSRKNNAQALQTCLQNPPVTTKTPSVKVNYVIISSYIYFNITLYFLILFNRMLMRRLWIRY